MTLEIRINKEGFILWFCGCKWSFGLLPIPHYWLNKEKPLLAAKKERLERVKEGSHYGCVSCGGEGEGRASFNDNKGV
jgi:hypothetical protein